ncbi:hypothetical protein ACIHQR_10330 [Corallococcus coralloides]|uniref:hypothetical protein n=1 Tax=Corallococcus coralloides TaxID=184914 RepID=UPI00384B810B
MNIDDWLDKQAERHFAMQKLTGDSVLHRYWEFAEEHVKNGFLPFVIKGGVAWKSDSGTRMLSPGGSLWLESRYDDLDIGKAVSSGHEIWGGRSITLDISNVEDSRTRIEDALEEIALVSNAISLRTGASLNWFPARHLEVIVRGGNEGLTTPGNPIQERKVSMNIALSRHYEEQTSAIISDDTVTKDIFNLIEHIKLIPSKRAQDTIKTAMSWHAQAGIIPSGLNRFLNYWSSIELICHSFYENLPDEAVGRLQRRDRDAKLAELMAAPIADNERARAVLDWSEIVRPTARTKITKVFKLLYPADGGEHMNNSLFKKDPESRKSMIDIRNDIAHGNSSEYDREFVSLISDRLPIIRDLSQDVIIASINKAKTLPLRQ